MGVFGVMCCYCKVWVNVVMGCLVVVVLIKVLETLSASMVLNFITFLMFCLDVFRKEVWLIVKLCGFVIKYIVFLYFDVLGKYIGCSGCCGIVLFVGFVFSFITFTGIAFASLVSMMLSFLSVLFVVVEGFFEFVFKFIVLLVMMMW